MWAAIIGGAFSGSVASAQDYKIDSAVLADGLEHPWGMTFISDAELLITERSGAIRRFHFEQGLSSPLSNVPKAVVANQGGMLDIIADPDFTSNQTVYFCYNKQGEGGTGSSVAKAQLNGTSLENVEHIFDALPLVENNGFHFGCRLAFDADQYLFIGLGDRYKYMQQAQATDNHFGKLIRINKDGSVPTGNPFADGKAPQIYSYGHRNIQGMTVDPKTNQLWAMEHGPKGGDEVNKIERGANYGWPKITFGIDYNGSIISDKTSLPGMQQPEIVWVPSIAPSGMAFYYGEPFKAWNGDLLVGALKFRHLRRIEMQQGTPGEQHEYIKDIGERIRDVEVGPDGLIYVLTDEDNGKLIRLSPRQ